jgi:hypothetical protein
VVPYESFQPALYYLAAAFVSQLIQPYPQMILYIGRLLAILLGAGTVYFCWLTTKEFAPEAPIWAIGVAGVVALLPPILLQHRARQQRQRGTVNLYNGVLLLDSRLTTSRIRSAIARSGSYAWISSPLQADCICAHNRISFGHTV